MTLCVPRKTWLVGVFLLIPSIATFAQPFYFGNDRPRETTAVMALVTAIDFEFNGDNAPPSLLNFSQPAYGLAFSRSNIHGAVAWGRQNAADTSASDLSLIDLSISFWGEMFFSENARTADHRIFAPIMLFTTYRNVSPNNGGSLDEFNITTLGLGLGLGYYGAFGENVLLEFRSVPALGYSAQSFGESTGLAQMIDSDLQLHIASVFNRIGISLGYGLRIKVWNMNASSIIGDISDDLFDYRDVKHAFSLGVNW